MNILVIFDQKLFKNVGRLRRFRIQTFEKAFAFYQRISMIKPGFNCSLAEQRLLNLKV